MAAESADSCAACSTFSDTDQFKRRLVAYRLGIKCQELGYTEKCHEIGYTYNPGVKTGRRELLVV